MRYLLLALFLSGCTAHQEDMERTYACFDGLNQVCDVKGCTSTEFQRFTQRCKEMNKTNRPGLWSAG